eukprot:4203453-Prymnesium_polylepis.1
MPGRARSHPRAARAATPPPREKAVRRPAASPLRAQRTTSLRQHRLHIRAPAWHALRRKHQMAEERRQLHR